MKYFLTLILVMVLSANICAQNYSSDVTLRSQNDNSVTLTATAVGNKKKEAQELAVKSAFLTLFHSGIDNVNNGVAIFPSGNSMGNAQKSYEYQLFTDGRYINYIVGDIQYLDCKKIAGKQRATVMLTINIKALCADMENHQLTLSPAWAKSDAKSTNNLNPTIVILPYTTIEEGGDFESMRHKLESSPATRYIIDGLAAEFKKNGYKTRDFINQLQNSKTDMILRTDAQTDYATMIVQQIPGDIIVTVNVDFISSGRACECFLNLKAIEKQTNGQLATESFASGKYFTSDKTELAKHALKNIKSEFFTQINNSFEEMVKNGREVFIELNLSNAIEDWDFEQDSPETGDYFKDALDEWLRENAFQNNYDMSNSTDKYIKIRLNIPLWDMDKNRSYTLSNFRSDIRKFFKKQLGDYYKASITASGQKLSIIIE